MEKRSKIAHGDMAIHWTSAVIRTAHDETGLSLLEQLGYFEIDYLIKAVKPQKKTILHDYIEAIIMDDFFYWINKHFPGDVIMELDDCMKYYQVDITALGERMFQFDSDGELKCGNLDDAEVYADNLLDLFKKKLLTTLADDVFTLLYSDKNFLAFFCSKISEKVRDLKVADYPEMLTSDGVIKRCSYWPSWLLTGIEYRDKGRCQLCGCDTTAILRPGVILNIDHIVPLDNGGINDPINLQLTCEHCNKSKGARSKAFNNVATPFWPLDLYEQD